MNVTLTPTALDDLRYWLKTDKRQTERIFALFEEIRRTPFDGIGKPEPLRFQLAGCWSRRIDRKHRQEELIFVTVFGFSVFLHQLLNLLFSNPGPRDHMSQTFMY
ncbi:MAG: Txe/YoeB family addiction module toxin [Desulfuromonadaceae bacterium]|nr:Txe/YoeB family addiction module toxin [Desulfuromonadaceae bacterium]MDD2855370.1 Txe/YoeB family addiction module toxin [Desulfuromonadaceae bacterium]